MLAVMLLRFDRYMSNVRHARAMAFSRARLAGVRGAGVEIVLEVQDVDAAFEEVERAGFSVVEPLRERPWGLRDFRVVDPNGYYVRVTTH